MNFFAIVFVFTFVFSLLLTGAVRRACLKYKILSKPRERDVHQKPIPRLGGVAIGLTILFSIALLVIFSPDKISFVSFKVLGLDKNLLGIIGGIIILWLVGLWDDFRPLSPWVKLLAQIFAALSLVASGITVYYLSNPFGAPIILDNFKIPIFTISGITYNLTFWSDIFLIVWTVLIINVINWLDGLDGLAAGIVAIAGVVIFFLSNSPAISQIATATLALVLVGSSLGFLPWNFNPAKIFMGDSGSMILGFLLATLSVVSGGKVATAFLVLGIGIFDAVWVIARRILRHSSPFRADRRHLHHRLLEIGLSQRQAVLVMYFISALFGILALFASTPGEKFNAIIWLGILMFALAITVLILQLRKKYAAKKLS